MGVPIQSSSLCKVGKRVDAKLTPTPCLWSCNSIIRDSIPVWACTSSDGDKKEAKSSLTVL